MEFYKVKDYPQQAFSRAYRKKAYLKLRNRIKHIAVYKSGAYLGDLVQSVPLFRSLKEMFPQAKIAYLGLYQRPRCDNLFKNIPYIDEYIEYISPGQKRGFKEYSSFLKKYLGKFDLIVDTQPKFKPSFYLLRLRPRYFLSRNTFFSHWRLPLYFRIRKVHVVAKLLSLVRLLGFNEINFSPAIEIPKEFLSFAWDYLKKFSGTFVCIIPTAGSPYKMWPKEKFADLADRFYAQGYQVILVGADSERQLLVEVAGMMKNKPIIPLVDEPRFGEEPLYSAGLFKFSALTVGNDCGGLHLATLAGCPVIGIYGPTNPEKFGPLGNKNVVLYKGLRCSPCRKKDYCRFQQRCLKEILPEEVIQAADFIMRS